MNDWALMRRQTFYLFPLGSGGVMLFCLMLLLFTSCPDQDANEGRNCAYDLRYGGHFLRVPITISPHQPVYRIGDTIKFSTSTTNLIEDLSSGESFIIENFPFKPESGLYRFSEGMEWDAGYRVNELRIDSIYQPRYNFSSNFADSFVALTRYVDGYYEFEFELILREKGRYLLLLSDLFQSHAGGGNSELNAEAKAITFEGKCPVGYYICSMVEGPTYLEDYAEELLHLDQAVYRGGLSSSEAGTIGPLGTGGVVIELSGFFGFEVVE